MMTRGDAAVVRLWLWRIAALKLLLPFSLLFALGAMAGISVAAPRRSGAAALLDRLSPRSSPLRLTRARLCVERLAVAARHAGGLRRSPQHARTWLRGRLRIERARAGGSARRELDVDDIRRGRDFSLPR